MEGYVILNDNVEFLEINVEMTYFENNEFVSEYKKILYNVEDEILIENAKIYLKNVTKFRKKVSKLLGTDKYTYAEANIRIHINRDVISNYQFDYKRELAQVSLNFHNDKIRKQWKRVQKIKNVLNE